MKNQFELTKRPVVIAICLLALMGTNAFGQAAGQAVSAALSTADTEIRKSVEPLINIMYVVMCIIGLIGAISVFTKWNSGDPDTRKAASAWAGALIFAGLVVIVLKAVFNVN